MQFHMDDFWRMCEVIGIPLFLWMERRTTKAQADAQWARTTAEQSRKIAEEAKAAVEKVRGEQSAMQGELLTKVESLSVALARIEGRLESVFERNRA